MADKDILSLLDEWAAGDGAPVQPTQEDHAITQDEARKLWNLLTANTRSERAHLSDASGQVVTIPR